MPRITFTWPEQRHFATDCPAIARMFLRGPDGFQPRQSAVLTEGVRRALLNVLESYDFHTEDRRHGLSTSAGSVEMTIRESKHNPPLR